MRTVLGACIVIRNRRSVCVALTAGRQQDGERTAPDILVQSHVRSLYSYGEHRGRTLPYRPDLCLNQTQTT